MRLTCSISSRQDRDGNARHVVRFPRAQQPPRTTVNTESSFSLFTIAISGTTTAITSSSSSSTTSARPTTTGKSWARTATAPTDGPFRLDPRHACSQRVDHCTTTSSPKSPAPRRWRRISWRSIRRRSRQTSSRRVPKKLRRGITSALMFRMMLTVSGSDFAGRQGSNLMGCRLLWNKNRKAVTTAVEAEADWSTQRCRSSNLAFSKAAWWVVFGFVELYSTHTAH